MIAETPQDLQRRFECNAMDQVLGELAAQLAPEAWERVERVLRLTISLYSAGLERTIDHARAAGADPTFGERLAEDDLVRELLAVHGLR